jgi:hypothetical protein
MSCVKNKFRLSLQEENLNDLMVCNMSGPLGMEFDTVQVVDQWYFSSKTTRHVHDRKKPNNK